MGRVFRIARLLRLVKRAKGLKMLFNTMLTSLPSMANIGSLMCAATYLSLALFEPQLSYCISQSYTTYAALTNHAAQHNSHSTDIQRFVMLFRVADYKTILCQVSAVLCICSHRHCFVFKDQIWKLLHCRCKLPRLPSWFAGFV